ncbi:hypothetical protein VPH35_049143 [Triticum aestivum]|uniref:DUF1618 domain-containing protein n=1 Tax=Triticum aestivum TaxID=4565 RepID=A0A077RPJ7_WHEAT|nr:unnamed protein product [Triticum aestivum]
MPHRRPCQRDHRRVTSQGRSIKVTFELANPPAVSRCFVHCPDVAESRYGGDPVVVSSADAFVLLVVPFTDRYGRSLDVYRSDISRWPWRNQVVGVAKHTTKYHNHEVIMRHQGTRVIFAGRGTLGWVNHLHGILLCNVLDHSPIMHFIQLPVPAPCNLVSRFGMGVDNISERPLRDVVISNGVIKFIELKSSWRGDSRNEKGVIGHGWTATTWNREICSKKWHKRFTFKADDMPVTGSSYPNLLGGKRFSWDKVLHGSPTLSLCDDDVVYIMARMDIRPAAAWMLAINIKEETLKAVKQCSTERMPGLEPTYVRCALSDYLKQPRRIWEDTNLSSYEWCKRRHIMCHEKDTRSRGHLGHAIRLEPYRPPVSIKHTRRILEM